MKTGAFAAALLEAEVDEAIALCGGDVRAALRATLVANAYLESEVERLSDDSTARLSGREPRRLAMLKN